MSDTRPSTIERSRQSTACSRAPFAARSTTRRRSGKLVSGRPSPPVSSATISAVSRSKARASSSVSARGRARHRSAPRADTVRPASGRAPRLPLLKKNPPTPPPPPPFCQLLRARLEGARIDHIDQVHDDRIVRLDMQRNGKPVTLIAELTGRTANVMLLDEVGAVRGQLRKGRLKHGETYVAPVGKSQAPGKAGEIRTDTQATEEFSISAELERRYQERDEARARARQLDAFKAGLRKTLKRAVKRIEALEADLAKAERYHDYNRYGELLKSHLGEIQKGAASITVPDYFDPALPEIVLPLDPAKSPQGNLDDYFRKYKKYRSEEHTSELQSRLHLVCRLLLEKKKKIQYTK